MTTYVPPNMIDPASGSLGFRNRIINGDMRIDQRNNGASQSINNVTPYTVDRWYVNFTGGTGTSQRVSGTGGLANALRLTGGAGVSSGFFGQKIESFNSADLAGLTVTVTIRASSSVLTSLSWFSRFPNTQDNYASVTAISSGSITINSTPTNYTFQFTCPSGVSNGLEVYFTFGSFPSGTLDITGVQLEAGSVATPFERRPYGTELMLCQRYFYRSGGSFAFQSHALGTFTSTQTVDAPLTYPVPFRATPSLTVNNLASFITTIGGVPSSIVLQDAPSINNNQLMLRIQVPTASTVGYSARLYSNNNAAATLDFSAEL